MDKEHKRLQFLLAIEREKVEKLIEALKSVKYKNNLVKRVIIETEGK